MLKTFEELMASSLKKLNESYINGNKITIRKGDFSRLILATINKELADMYEYIDSKILNLMLSTAEGEYLEKIGMLVSCDRQDFEDDKSYRTRISMRVTELEMANEYSIYMGLLGIDGVQDVKLKSHTHGTGSFSAVILTNDGVKLEEIKNDLDNIIGKRAAYGIKAVILEPTNLEVKIKMAIPLTDKETKLKIKEDIQLFLNSRAIGERLSLNALKKNIMDKHDINDIDIIEININDKECILKDISCRWNERIIESSNSDSVIII